MNLNLAGIIILLLLLGDATLFAVIIYGGAKGYWVWGHQYRELLAVLRQLQGTTQSSVAATRAAANVLESQSPLFKGRRYLTALRRRIGVTFNEDELQTICFDLALDYDNLAAATFAGKIRELLEELVRQNRVSELVVILARERPAVDWTTTEAL